MFNNNNIIEGEQEAKQYVSNIPKITRILIDAENDPVKFARIIRTQMAQEGRLILTPAQINHSKSDKLHNELIKQEMEESKALGLKEDQIVALLKSRVSIGRLMSARPGAIGAYYQGKCSTEKPPYIRLAHFGRALNVTCGDLKEKLVKALRYFVEDQLPHYAGDNPNTIEGLITIIDKADPGTMDLYEGRPLRAEDTTWNMFCKHSV